MQVFTGWEEWGLAALSRLQDQQGIEPMELSRLKRGVDKAKKRIEATLDTDEKRETAQLAVEMKLPKEIQMPTGKLFSVNVDKVNRARGVGTVEKEKGQQAEEKKGKWERFESLVEMVEKGNQEASRRSKKENQELMEQYAE